MILNVLCALAIAGAALLAELAIRRAVASVALWWKVRTISKPLRAPVRTERRAMPTGGKVMAYLLLLAGTAATMAANIAHAQENIGARALSAVIPALLFMAFHVAAYDQRRIIRVGTGVVAVLCFGISYDHISALARRYGEGNLSAVLYPLAIDGAMVVATFVLSRPATVRTEEPSVRPKPVRKAEPVLPAVLSETHEDSPRTNGFVRPMPPRTVRTDNAARLSAAQKIADDLGDSLSRARLVEELKKQNYSISTGAAAALVRELKAARS